MSDEIFAADDAEGAGNPPAATPTEPTPEVTTPAMPMPPVNPVGQETPLSDILLPPVSPVTPVTNEPLAYQPPAAATPPPPPPTDPTYGYAAPPPPTDPTYGYAAPPPPTDPTYGAPAGGSYALGALAGNPHLSAAPGPGVAAPPSYPYPPYAAPQVGTTPPATKSHRGRNVFAIAAAVVVALAAGVGIGHGAWTSNSANTSALTPPTSNPSSGSSGSSGNPFGFGSNGNSGNSGSSGSSGNSGSSGASGGSGPNDVSSIAAKVDPGLVDIDTTLGYQSEEAAGTGIVLTSGGEVLTNNHVIDGATTISVTDVGNDKTYSASVVGYDRTSDIAVLQLHDASGLQTATLGNSDNVSVGEDVVGIGNAGGTGGTPSAAGGTVTALNQSITASDEGDGSSEQLVGLIETNADIQPGDSGGSLVDSSGQVLGIDTAASQGFSFAPSSQTSGNQGYAIPIDTAVGLAQKIVDSDASSTIHIGATAFLGVSIEPSSDSGSGSSGFGGLGGFGSEGGSGSSSTVSGVTITQVVTSSPAQEAGLAAGDVITSINGTKVTTPDKITELLEPDHPGDTITVTWTDTSGTSHTATAQLSSGPPQ